MPLGWLLINPVQATFERTCSESSARSVPSSAGIEKDLGLFRADKSYEAELPFGMGGLFAKSRTQEM
ncbi:hypothetical protein WN51_04607 [Melipona quadrifasciata]|uniref:Uncharacterized protein n=1 Tax=Melipona quadrifasciata TaxID=166423 RepID=A0A0M8ZS85_9HYME|nr:hypothetical protein WN51_04607 [Melipona quadrifasciata]